ncbi:MAG: hypothetical protein QX191_09050 [Methylococcaceae bacterium]
MGKALAVLWNSLSILFEAVGRFCNAANNIGKWTEETSESFVDDARANRAKANIVAKKELQALKVA